MQTQKFWNKAERIDHLRGMIAQLDRILFNSMGGDAQYEKTKKRRDKLAAELKTLI